MADFNSNMMIKEFNMPEDQAKAAAMDGLVTQEAAIAVKISL